MSAFLRGLLITLGVIVALVLALLGLAGFIFDDDHEPGGLATPPPAMASGTLRLCP